jgi:hypothetical protein
VSTLTAQSVTVVRAPLAGTRYGGGQTRDWDAATRTVVDRVSVQPGGGTEDVRDRDMSVSSWTLYTARGQDIDLLATDRVEVDGRTLQVDGDPNRWPAPGGGVHHVEARLKEVTG